MTERMPADAAARAAAIDPERSFIVQAPAGSGKTSLLTDRILGLLARVQQPEQVVAMTFTRKAAAEMHARVMQKLQRADREPAPSDRHERQGWELARAALARDTELGWGLLMHPARLRIQTIDSFCASLVRAMPWLTGLGAMPRIVEDANALYEQAALQTVQSADTQDCVRELLMHLDLAVQDVVDALADMLAKRDQWLPLIGQGGDLQRLQDHLQQSIELDLQRIAKAMPAGWQHQLAEPARLCAQTLIKEGLIDDPIAALSDWQQAGGLRATLEHLPMWLGLRQLLLTGPGSVRKSVTVKQGCPRDAKYKPALTEWLAAHGVGKEPPRWAQALAQVKDLPTPTFSEAQWQIINTQLGALRLAAANLLMIFAQRAEVDFIEVALRAVDALGQAEAPSDLLLKLDQRIAHLLVDEFQDTSSTQLHLLRLLTAGWQPDDGRTLFLVGDPMQSIYRFRKAEVGLFLQVQQQGIGEVMLEPLTLTANFRSQAGLVQWVNQTFAPMFPPENDPVFGAIRYEPSEPWHAASAEPAVRWHVQTDEPTACEQVVQIARGAWQQHAESEKPMAILVRSRSHLGEVTRELVRAGLPCRAIELDSLQSRPLVVDLMQLTRALVHRGDRAAWVAVLRAPWCGLTLGTLHRLLPDPKVAVCDALAKLIVKSDQWAGQIDPDQRARLLGVAPVLLAATQDDTALPLVARIEAAWLALEGQRLASEANELDDVQAFFALLQRLAQHSVVDLDLLEQQLAKLYAQPQTAGRAIEVMTMHKAKGLEFEVVVLLGLARKPASDRAPMLRVEQLGDQVLFGPIKSKVESEKDPLAAYLGTRESIRQRLELDRLLYVASTRARQSLHLVLVCGVDPKTDDWRDPLPSSLLARFWSARPPLPAPAAARTDQPIDAQAPWRVAPAMRRRLEPLPARVPAVLKERANDRFAWPLGESAERISGVLIHAWLARFARQAAEPDEHALPTSQTLERQLRALGLPDQLRVQAGGEVRAALAAMLQNERGRWLLSQPLRQVEWALIDAAQTVSIMDLAIDLPDGWLVVDYKTSRPGEQETEAAFAARMCERYSGQMQRYRQQLQGYDQRAVRTVLYFPRDDRWIELEP